MFRIRGRRYSLDSAVSPTGVDLPPPVRSPNIYHSIQPFIQELECLHPSTLQEKGMLTWTLHKNLEQDPSKATVVLEELVKDLEMVQIEDKKGCIIPLLITLIYVVFQSVYIPKDLYDRAYAACKSLLTLPKPYCDVGLACVRHIQTERSKPGALYQRTVTAEQNLWNESFPYQEMLFVFADAAIFSGSLGDAVKWHLEQGGSRRRPVSHMCAVLQHTLQAALGESCHSSALAHTLKDLGRRIEPYFKEVVQAVEQNAEEAGKASGYRDRLERLHRDILSAAGPAASAHGSCKNEGEPSGGSVCDIPFPTPDVRFHLWQREAELWLQLEKWIQECLGEADRDSGIEKDLPENEWSSGSCKKVTQDRRSSDSGHNWVRKPCMKKRPIRAPSLPSFPRDFSIDLGSDTDGDVNRNLFHFTASVMVMGDDRVLGRLAKAYHALRTGEASLTLVSRVNLEIYYIPVTDQLTAMVGSGRGYLELASHLGRADPWYECNISSLAHWIPTLEETAKTSKSRNPNPFLLDVVSYYKRTAWQPVHLPIYSVKIIHPNKERDQEQVFLTYLEVDFLPCTTNVETMKRVTTSPAICGPVVSITYRKVSLNNRQVEKGVSSRTAGILISTIPTVGTEDPNQLTLRFKETQPRTSRESMIQSRHIKIKTVEKKTFTVRLDKDTGRTYEDVRSIEISPCQDPRDIRNQALCLPINTFSGINQ